MLNFEKKLLFLKGTFTFNKLDYFTDYEIRVTVDSKDIYLGSFKKATFGFETPSSVDRLETIRLPDKSILVNWQPPINSNAPAVCYYQVEVWKPIPHSSYFIKTSSIVESMRSIALNHQKLAGYILEKLWSAFDKSQHKRVILETLKGIIMYSDDSRRQGLKFLDKKASVFFTGPPTLEAVPDGVYWKIMSYSEMDDSSLKKKVLALLYTCIKKQKSDGKELKNDGLYTFWMDRYPALEIPNR